MILCANSELGWTLFRYSIWVSSQDKGVNRDDWVFRADTRTWNITKEETTNSGWVWGACVYKLLRLRCLSGLWASCWSMGALMLNELDCLVFFVVVGWCLGSWEQCLERYKAQKRKKPTQWVGFSIFQLRRIWWRETDSNHRRQCRQIYSLLPLATREPLQGVSYSSQSKPKLMFSHKPIN